MKKIIHADRKFERQVASLLQAFGHKIHHMPYQSPFDLLMDGKLRIEIKTAPPITKLGRPCWNFNIHRHNIVEESQIDYYILRFENVPWCKYAIHALFKAPIEKPTLQFGFRQLLEGAISEQVKAFNGLNIKKTKPKGE